MRMRTAAALLLVAGLLRPAAADATLDRALTVVGSRTSYATIVVTQEIRYDLHRATASWAGGRWGGFLIGPDSSRPDHDLRDRLTLWTAYDDPQAAGHQSDALFSGYPAFHRRDPGHKIGLLPPGRWRVYLFTDGQEVRITLPWSAPSRTVRPDPPFAARIDVRQAALTAAEPSTLITMRLDGTARSVTEAAAAYDTVQRVPDTTRYAWSCFAHAARPPTPESCYQPKRSERRDGTSYGRRGEVRGARVHRMYGSMTPFQWRYAASAATTPTVLTTMTVRYDP